MFQINIENRISIVENVIHISLTGHLLKHAKHDAEFVGYETKFLLV